MSKEDITDNAGHKLTFYVGADRQKEETDSKRGGPQAQGAAATPGPCEGHLPPTLGLGEATAAARGAAAGSS